MDGAHLAIVEKVAIGVSRAPWRARIVDLDLVIQAVVDIIAAGDLSACRWRDREEGERGDRDRCRGLSPESSGSSGERPSVHGPILPVALALALAGVREVGLAGETFDRLSHGTHSKCSGSMRGRSVRHPHGIRRCCSVWHIARITDSARQEKGEDAHSGTARLAAGPARQSEGGRVDLLSPATSANLIEFMGQAGRNPRPKGSV